MVRSLVQRHPADRPRLTPREQLIATDRERASDLLAGGVLLARDLGVRTTTATALKQPGAEPGADPLTRRQPRMRLGERPPAPLAAAPPLAPTQIRDPSRQRQVLTRTTSRSLTVNDPRPNQSTTPCPGQQLYLELDPLPVIAHAGHGHPLDPEKSANVILHPLFLLVRVFDNASFSGTADVSIRASTPLDQRDPFLDRRRWVTIQSAPTDAMCRRLRVRAIAARYVARAGRHRPVSATGRVGGRRGAAEIILSSGCALLHRAGTNQHRGVRLRKMRCWR